MWEARRSIVRDREGRDAVELLLERGADVHAIHGAGRGSQRLQPARYQAIDLAVGVTRQGCAAEMADATGPFEFLISRVGA
jgi:hypothetical protein